MTRDERTNYPTDLPVNGTRRNGDGTVTIFYTDGTTMTVPTVKPGSPYAFYLELAISEYDNQFPPRKEVSK